MDPTDFELLGIVTRQLEEIAGYITDKLLINEGIQDLLDTGLEIRAMVEEDTALKMFSKYDVDKATTVNFEDDFVNYTGENTDELIQPAHEAAMEKQDELFETSLG